MKIRRMRIGGLLLALLTLSGCWSSREINTLAIAVSNGIDKSGAEYTLTQQLLNPKAIAAQKTRLETPVLMYAETGKDLFEMKRKISTQCPRTIYNSHLRLVVIGEALAREGITPILDFFTRGSEYRTDYFFVVAKATTARRVLSVLTPMETVPAIEMYDTLLNSEHTWAPTKTIKIIELVNAVVSEGNNPVLTVVELHGKKEIAQLSSIDSLKQVTVEENLNFTGLGVFRKDKLVGWLNEHESKGYNYISGNVKSTGGYVELGRQNKITCEVIRASAQKKAYRLHGKPAINVKINIVVNLVDVTGKPDVSQAAIQAQIIRNIQRKITAFCYEAVQKAQQYESDIFGFGEVIHRAYPVQWRSLKQDWNRRFVDLPIQVQVKAEINQLGQISKSYFVK